MDWLASVAMPHRSRLLSSNDAQLCLLSARREMMPTFEYTLDDEPQTTTEHQLTPAAILTNGGIDAATHYLVELRGKDGQHSFENTPNDPIHMHQKMRFISISKKPTPVSAR